jgi:hypothetical protein
VVTGDHDRAPAAEALGDPLGDDRVARHHPQDRPLVPRRVVAARLVVARDARPGRHRSEQRDASRRRGLDRVGDGA